MASMVCPPILLTAGLGVLLDTMTCVEASFGTQDAVVKKCKQVQKKFAEKYSSAANKKKIAGLQAKCESNKSAFAFRHTLRTCILHTNA